MSGAYSTVSMPASSTSGGTRSRLSFLSTQDDAYPLRKPSGTKVATPRSCPQRLESTLFTPVGWAAANTPTQMIPRKPDNPGDPPAQEARGDAERWVGAPRAEGVVQTELSRDPFAGVAAQRRRKERAPSP